LYRLSILVFVSLSLVVPALCDVPPVINYQGKLMQPSGAPVPDGAYSMTFAIYDVPTGGTPLWSETNPSVQVKGGLFAVLLGSINNLPANIFDNPNRWFGVKVGDDPEMTPRQQIASTGFAFRAAVAGTVDDGAITTEKIADGAVTAGKIADSAVSGANIAPGAVGMQQLAAPEPWNTATLLNGWEAYPAPFAPPGFCRDITGVVRLRGRVRNGRANSKIFVLPEGFRPTHHLLFPSMTRWDAPEGVVCQVEVNAAGEVALGGSYADYVSLDGISFRTDQ
jgi:hypothetical protein